MEKYKNFRILNKGDKYKIQYDKYVESIDIDHFGGYEDRSYYKTVNHTNFFWFTKYFSNLHDAKYELDFLKHSLREVNAVWKVVFEEKD